ncbi:MAG TPA: hypothetical protein VGM90_23075 [Kofleriaceae bacterium]
MRTLIAATCVLGAVLGAGCTADSSKVRPIEDELFYPTGMAVAPDDSVAFVANANSELRYDSGAVMVLDLALVDSVISDWVKNKALPDGDDDGDGEADCAQDPDRSETLICDESRFFEERAGVRIGNFATDIGIQDRGNGALRLFVPTRGDPSIAWADWDGSRLACSSNSDPDALCDDNHRLSYLNNDSGQSSIPEEPFNVYADSKGEFAMVTHLTSGAVTLINSPKDSQDVGVTDVLTGIFAADGNGLRGATGVTGSPSGNGIVYVGSRTEDRIQTFTVGHPANGASPFLLPGEWFFLDGVGANTGGSSDTRGMTFSPSGERMYLVNRRPPSLQVYDESLTATGAPANNAIGATDICRQASTVAISGVGADERAYITCFQDGQLYVVNPRSGVYVEDIILVGRGPYSVATARSRNKLFVTNFLEDTIAVIDIDPASPTRNRVVLRIGTPKAP